MVHHFWIYAWFTSLDHISKSITPESLSIITSEEYLSVAVSCKMTFPPHTGVPV